MSYRYTHFQNVFYAILPPSFLAMCISRRQELTHSQNIETCTTCTTCTTRSSPHSILGMHFVDLCDYKRLLTTGLCTVVSVAPAVQQQTVVYSTSGYKSRGNFESEVSHTLGSG